MIKRRAGWGAVLAAAIAAWNGMAAPEVPAAFPKVTLAKGSIPYYASLMVDVATNQIAYVCFDGDVSNGYERLHFWIPNDAEYRTPKLFRYNSEAKRFGPISFRPKHDKDDIRIDWSFRWAPHGGNYTHFDYLTGQTRQVARGIYPRFFFDCSYQRRPRTAVRPADSLVDITIPGEIYASVWTNMPKALEPWHTLNYYMTTKQVRDKSHSLVRFTGFLRYGHHHPVEVRSLPREAACTLIVSPYLKAPVYSNDLNWAEAIGTGADVKLEYGWYDLDWNMVCPGLNVVARRDVWVRPSPFAITQFDD